MAELLHQDFENVETASYPDGWEKDGSSDQQVVASEARQGEQSLKLVGRHGGCWQAIANAPLGSVPEDKTISITGAVKPGADGSFGCHDNHYGFIQLRTAVGSWSSGEGRQLLLFGSENTLKGSGLELGEFSTDEWVEYEIEYTHKSSRNEVGVTYDIDGESRGSTTVDAIDNESKLSHLALHSGDFTAYWDEIVVEQEPKPKTTITTATPTRTPTETRTPTPTTTATSPRTTTVTQTPVDYDFRQARIKTEVTPRDQTVLVLDGIPNADGRLAVTTTDYQLVDTDTARDAFVTYVYGRSASEFNWKDALSYARTMRGKHGASELWNRAATVGWDALAAYAMAQLNPAAALGPVLEALQDSTAWAVHEISEPYMETMSKQTQWAYTHREIEQDIERAESLVEMSDFMFDFVDVGLTIHDVARTWRKALSAARTAYSASSSFSTSLAAGGAAVSSTVYYAAVGTLVSQGVGAITTGMEQNAKLSAIGHAYSTTRIPVIERLLELEDHRQNNALSPGGAWEYAYLTMNHHYMGAFANQGMYKHAHAIEQSSLGGIWDALVNVDEVASVLKERASSFQWGGATAHYEYGRLMRNALDLTDDSINRELGGPSTPIGGNT